MAKEPKRESPGDHRTRDDASWVFHPGHLGRGGDTRGNLPARPEQIASFCSMGTEPVHDTIAIREGELNPQERCLSLRVRDLSGGLRPLLARKPTHEFCRYLRLSRGSTSRKDSHADSQLFTRNRSLSEGLFTTATSTDVWTPTGKAFSISFKTIEVKIRTTFEGLQNQEQCSKTDVSVRHMKRSDPTLLTRFILPS
jgi:hypothetical protein